MRVVMVTYGFPRLSETFLVRKFLGLLEQGVDMRVVTWRSEAEDWERFEAKLDRDRIEKLVTVAPPITPRWRPPLLLPWVLIKTALAAPAPTLRYFRYALRHLRGQILKSFYMDAALISVRPDVIHFEFGSQAVGRTHLKEALDCKLVTSFRGHDIDFVGLDDPHFYDEVWRRSDAVHFLGDYLMGRARERGFSGNALVALIAPAVPVEAGSGTKLAPDSERPTRLLSVARLNWAKGHEFLLQTVRMLVDRNIKVHLRIVGGGDFLEAVAFARRQLHLEEHVEILGPLSPGQVEEQRAWADVFVHAAVEEGFANAVLEAQAAQLPVVTTDAGGLPNNIEDGVTGFVVPRRDPAAMADAVSRLILEPDLRDAMGIAGRARVAAAFKVEDQIEAFYRLYAEVMERPGTTTRD